MNAQPVEQEHPDYLAQRVWDALARDPRTNEMEVRVTVVGNKVFVHGTLATDERREGVYAVIAEVLPEHEIHNQTIVGDFPAAEAAEHVS
ncbi:MAG: BON domain-containing protein [Actinomycetota bacterium]